MGVLTDWLARYSQCIRKEIQRYLREEYLSDRVKEISKKEKEN